MANFREKIGISRMEIAVVVSGIVSMGLEILAGRVIAPEFGSTVYTWGSVIGVSMLALSLGYHYGGRKSPDIEGMNELEKYLGLTSVYVLSILGFGDTVLSASSAIPLSSIYAPIIPVTILFGPPMYFLGYVSPYAAQLSSKESKGEASGHFYAIGTAGSILGAFGTTFLLIPLIPVDYIYLMFAGLAVVPLVEGKKQVKSYSFLAVLLAGLMIIQTSPVSGTVYQTDTPYQELEVTREGNLTTMYLDGQPQSAKYMNSTESPWSYTDYFEMPFLMRDEIDNALFIGGGGFVGPQQYEEKGIKVDAVEIDPGVIEAAERFFNLSESENLEIHNKDGREFLKETSEEYDVVFLDAYKKDKVPFHLTTEEFFQLVYSKTDEDAVVVSNVISAPEGQGSEFAKAYTKTKKQEFETTYFFPTSDHSGVQNIQIIATKNPELSIEELKERNSAFNGENLTDEIEGLQNPETEGAEILTDDYAPVDRLTSPLAGRTYVAE